MHGLVYKVNYVPCKCVNILIKSITVIQSFIVDALFSELLHIVCSINEKQKSGYG